MSKPKNPLAFPRPGFDTPAGYEDGMSQRDYFAGQALAGINVFELVGWGDAEVAERVYDLAEAMMAERERRQ
ncbi:MAG: hypothetical protein ACT6Q7_02665 [Blastomonas fulva]|uniref:hypothetical protein n=1 Tax=Blastomonas fulva TaxID=1550728 RepID=UPI0040339D31